LILSRWLGRERRLAAVNAVAHTPVLTFCQPLLQPLPGPVGWRRPTWQSTRARCVGSIVLVSGCQVWRISITHRSPGAAYNQNKGLSPCCQRELPPPLVTSRNCSLLPGGRWPPQHHSNPLTTCSPAFQRCKSSCNATTQLLLFNDRSACGTPGCPPPPLLCTSLRRCQPARLLLWVTAPQPDRMSHPPVRCSQPCPPLTGIQAPCQTHPRPAAQQSQHLHAQQQCIVESKYSSSIRQTEHLLRPSGPCGAAALGICSNVCSSQHAPLHAAHQALC
jgi:hypothetical protein